MISQKCVGAEAAVRIILQLIREKLDEYKDKPDVVRALKEIEGKAREIEKTAQKGWF
ncbi:hypothetical protein KKD20_00540 [Patescibacteria group bacterium]|nr:hypothetical protein [Patescibacteria group bacterium]